MPKLKAEADNIDRGLNYSGYAAKAEFNNFLLFIGLRKTKHEHQQKINLAFIQLLNKTHCFQSLFASLQSVALKQTPNE